MLGNFACFCHPLFLKKIKLFQKILSETLSECQMVWILIRTKVLPDLGPSCMQRLSAENKRSKLYAKVISGRQKLPLARNSVGQNLGPSCLQRLSAEEKSSRRELSGSVVECLTRDPRAAGSSLTGVTALWSLSKTHLS